MQFHNPHKCNAISTHFLHQHRVDLCEKIHRFINNQHVFNISQHLCLIYISFAKHWNQNALQNNFWFHHMPQTVWFSQGFWCYSLWLALSCDYVWTNMQKFGLFLIFTAPKNLCDCTLINQTTDSESLEMKSLFFSWKNLSMFSLEQSKSNKHGII